MTSRRCDTDDPVRIQCSPVVSENAILPTRFPHQAPQERTGTAGLGFLIQSASGRLDTLLSVAAIVVISALAVALFRAVELLERLMLRNRESIPGAVA